MVYLLGANGMANCLLLNENEKVLWEASPTPNVYWVWLVTRCLPMFVFTAFAGAWLAGASLGISAVVYDSQVPVRRLAEWPLWSGPLGYAAMAVYTIFLRQTFKYCVTNQRCVFTGGLLSHKKHFVSYDKITDVEVSQNVIEKLAGTYSLRIFTAASPGASNASEMMRFEGLSNADEPAALIMAESRNLLHASNLPKTKP